MRPSSPLACVALVAAAACSEPAPAVDPLAFLRVGLDARAEADAVAAGFRRRGFTELRRITGDDHVALGFARRSPTRASAVRVVTDRGIAIALDAPNPRALDLAEVRLAEPVGPGGDIDADGRSEIVVELVDETRPRTCLRVLRVRPDGLVDELPIALPEAPDACVEQLADVGADRRPEAILVVRHHELARGEPPSVRALRTPTSTGWLPPLPGPFRGFTDRERAAREAELSDAREALDVERAYRVAVELAALSRLAGEPTGAQLEAFDRALSGLVLEPSQARSVAHARAYIGAGWAEPGQPDG